MSNKRGDSNPLLAGCSVDTPPRLMITLSFLSSTMTPIGQSAGVVAGSPSSAVMMTRTFDDPLSMAA